ncbi:L7Ae/L30e/S12e/Gadd45 family ribosomal protein [Alkalibaculum sporogenes]|nr:ribosomal L7Ae/L30e/S12e/Gadd45 family protein [Alkalibaculum sporogenes]
MEKDKFLKFLGLCKKSGKLISGDYSVEKSIFNNRTKLLIIAEDSSADKVQKYTQLSSSYNIELITCLSKEELGCAIGRNVCAIIGITDINQKNKLLSLYQ